MENTSEEKEHKQFSKEKINTINKSLNKIQSNITEIVNNCNKLFSIPSQAYEIQTKIKDFEMWLNIIKNRDYIYETNEKNKYFEILSKSFDKYNIYMNENKKIFETIKTLNFQNDYEIKELISNLPPVNNISSMGSEINIEFNEKEKAGFYQDFPPTINLNSYSDIINVDESSLNKKEVSINEKSCQKDKINEKVEDKIYEKIKEPKMELKEIKNFLNSIIQLIKRILMKSSYLLQNRIKRIKIVNNDKIENINIIRNFKFPYIINENNDESEIDFIKEMNEVINKEYDEIKFLYKDFDFYRLDNDLKKELLDIYDDKNTKEFLSTLKDFSIGSIEQDEINGFIMTETRIDKNTDNYNYIEELKKNKKEKENLWENYIKKYNYKNNNLDKEQYYNGVVNNNPKALLSSKEFSDLVKYLSKINIKRNKLIEEEIVKKMTSLFINRKNDFKLYIKYLLIDFFITTEQFSKISINDLIFYYPNMIELYIFKILIDELLCKECGIKELIDYKGNFINVGGFKIRKMKYSRPGIGWMGIGIKIEDKFYGEEYGNIYLTIGRELQSNEIKEKMKIIINDITFESKSLINILYCNKGNNIDTEKTKVFFSKDINYIENHSGIISFKNRLYRLILMAKIKAELLDENKLSDNFGEIKIYAILLKKVKN